MTTSTGYEYEESISDDKRRLFMNDYMIDETVEWITEHNLTIVGLQFPDELLPISVPIFRSLQSYLPVNQYELYIMADTTYGSCCVDQVAAQHVNAHAVVHYGPACLSTPPSLPVFYVLPRLPLSDDLIKITARTIFNSLQSSNPIPISKELSEGPIGEKILMMYDVGYHWKSESIVNCLQTQYNLSIVRHQLDLVESLSQQRWSTKNSCHNKQRVCGQSTTCCQENHAACDQSINLQTSLQQVGLKEEDGPIDSIEDTSGSTVDSAMKQKDDYSNYHVVIYIGTESPRLTHFLVTHPNLPVIVIDPNRVEEHLSDGEPNHSSPETQTNQTNKLLMRRYATIQKARDADVFGIIVGTLGVKNYLELIHRTKEMIEGEYQKKAYVISVGKLKPEKLMNFAEIEAWVLIDCPESSMLVLDGRTGQRYDPKQFGAPIVTPWELEIALASCHHGTSEAGDGRSRGVWNGRLVLDFDHVLSVWQPNSNSKDVHLATHEDHNMDPDAPVFSSVTGGYKYRKNWNQTRQTETKDLIKIESTRTKKELIEIIKGASVEYRMNKKSFYGLDASRFGLDPPAKIEKGRVGLPKSYQDDHPCPPPPTL